MLKSQEYAKKRVKKETEEELTKEEIFMQKRKIAQERLYKDPRNLKLLTQS